MSGYATAITAVTALASTAMSVSSGMQQANAQKQQAEYQSDMATYNAQVAEGNAKLAEAEGKRAKQEADKEATRKRQETSLLISQQRSRQGASGSITDSGSNLDFNLDLKERGELDALQLEEQGILQDYYKKLDAWGSRNQGAIQTSQAANHANKANQIDTYKPLVSNSGSLFTGLNNTKDEFIKLI